LPKYSPNLNEIEHDFSEFKRARMYSPINTSIIVQNTVSFLFKITILSKISFPQPLLSIFLFLKISNH